MLVSLASCRQSPAAATDIDDKMPAAQSERAQQVILQFTDCIEFAANRKPHRFVFAFDALFQSPNVIDIGLVARIPGHRSSVARTMSPKTSIVPVRLVYAMSNICGFVVKR